MDEQKLNEAAEEYAGISEDKFANSAKKYDAYDMADAFSSGYEWHEQQNAWRKVLKYGDPPKGIIVNVKTNQYSRTITGYCDGFGFWVDSIQNKPILVLEWKYID